MAKTFLLEVVTPDRKVFSEQVEFFSIRGAAGELGVLAGHIPLFTTIAPGLLHYKLPGGQEGVITAMGGFLNVQPDKATVLADAAERGEEIDQLRAQKAKEKAEMEMSRQNDSQQDLALQRAILRIKAYEFVNSTSAVRRR
jgi:F-type H+-transporting ATPase subunit epsilon